MTAPHPIRRCPDCGASIPDGLDHILCPACALDGGESEDLDGLQGLTIGEGKYTIMTEIARGGMAVIYRAIQAGLNREVAIKVLPGTGFDSRWHRERFQQEAKTAARLLHPNIVRIHEIGECHGKPFISMDFVDGHSLADELAKGTMGPTAAARIVRTIAGAVEHAHQRGVSHCDLKPSNVLIDLDGTPVLTDFGLAMFSTGNPAGDEAKPCAGSPAYMAPEKLAPPGNAPDDGISGDVYGLGAVLYHCLAGRPPFVADTLPELLAAVEKEIPIALRTLNPSIPLDLQTICLKCLEKNPSGRYHGAAEVAAELARFLDGKPILARPLSPVLRVWRTMKSEPLATALGLGLLITLATGSTVTAIGWKKANDSLLREEIGAESLRTELYSANLLAASSALAQGDRVAVDARLLDCVPSPGKNDLRGIEWFLMKNLTRDAAVFSTTGHAHIAGTLAWSPDGKSLASGSQDGTLKVWAFDHTQGSLGYLRDLVHQNKEEVRQCVWSPDGGHLLAAIGSDIRCLTAGGEEAWRIPGQSFSLAPDAGLLAVSHGSPYFFGPPGPGVLWSLASPGDWSLAPRKISIIAGICRAIAISPDGKRFAYAQTTGGHHDREKGIVLRDTSQPSVPRIEIPTLSSVWSLVFSPDGSKLAATFTRSREGWQCYDSLTGHPLVDSTRESPRIWSTTFSADSSEVLTTGTNRSLAMVRLNGSPGTILPFAHDNEIWAAAIHPAGQWMVSGDKNGVLKIFPFPINGGPMDDLPEHPHFRYARPVGIPRSGDFLVWTPENWKTEIWKSSTGKTEPFWTGTYPLRVDEDGHAYWFSTGSNSLFHGRDNSPPGEIPLPLPRLDARSNGHCQGVSRSGAVYRIEPGGDAVVVLPPSGGIHVRRGFAPGQPMASSLSPDGRYLAASFDATLRVWDRTTDQIHEFPNHHHLAKAIEFSIDDQIMITGGVDGKIILRKTNGFDIMIVLTGHLAEVSGLALSPDGRTLVSSEIGAGLRFWRMDTRREVLRLAMPDICERITFSPDGRTLAVVVCPPGTAPECARLRLLVGTEQ